MRLIKNITVILFMFLLSGCIKPYDPLIDSNVENKYVVSGRITDKEGWQEVEVSLSSSIESPVYIALSGCLVKIHDNTGNEFPLEEYQPGKYHVWMGQENLHAGTSYQVSVSTPAGEEILSGFDTMPKGPQLDSVYYAIEDIPTSDPENYLRVMQFYVDLNAEGDYSQYYKWEVTETYEYEAAYPAEYYFDGAHHEIKPPDYSNKVCYASGLIKKVFTISTKNLTQNIYHRYPLHYIDGSTSRLGILYSILVRQFAMSEAAYNYWEQLRINSNEKGGLYEKQPLSIKGNLKNLTNTATDVLGYFQVVSVSERRYFYHNIPGIELNFSDGCLKEGLGRGGWKEFYPSDFPVYYNFSGGSVRILSRECVDCRLMGGTTVKPDFWPR